MDEKSLVEELAGIRRALERLGDIMLAVAEIEAPGPVCPGCGSANHEDTSAMGDPRRTCSDCGMSWEPAEGTDD